MGAHQAKGADVLLPASQDGHVERVDALLGKGADANEVNLEDGNFPLLMAATNGHSACVEALLGKGADANHVKSQNGNFPLLLAAKNGHSACVEALLAKGADANQVNPQTGSFPLLMAATKSHAECTNILVKRGARRASEISGSPVLEAALNAYEDPTLVRRAIEADGKALKLAPSFKGDKVLVLIAVGSKGAVLEHASEELQRDEEVVRRAVKQDPGALRFAGSELVQRQDFLEAAGMLRCPSSGTKRLVVMSVRFALCKTASAASTYAQLFLSNHGYLKKFQFYNPNAFNKGFCKKLTNNEIDWDAATDKSWKCRGRLEGATACDFPEVCSKRAEKCKRCKGHGCNAPCETSCWRYSFAWHQELAKSTNGFMLQVIEQGELGKGQEIEEDMAKDIGLTIFKISVAENFNPVKDEISRQIIKSLELKVKAHGF